MNPQTFRSQQLLCEQTRLLYGAVKGALLATAINSGLLIAMLWSVVDHSILLAWFGVLMLLSCARLFLTAKYNSASVNPSNAALWYRRFAIGALLSAATWGCASIFIYPQLEGGYQVIFTFVIGGMAAGSLTSLGFEKKLVTAFLTVMMVPLLVSDIEKGADPKLLEALWPTLMSSGKLEVECTHRRKDGSTFPVEVHLGPVEIGDEKYISAFVRDITLHKKALNDSNRAKQEAQRLNLAKSEFLSRMSHELRTPLNAILGFSQVLQLRSENLSSIQRINIDEIYKAGSYLLSLIEELLDLSKIELGKLELSMEEVDITLVLDECVRLLETQAFEAQVEIQCNFNCQGCRVWGDPVRVKQVVVNLLSNAVKYNSVPGKVILSTQVQAQNRLRIRVKDTGQGIPEASIARMFEPFERLEGSELVDGSGIGLALAKYLAQEMGGEIGVNSQVGQGSEFWVDLELCQSASLKNQRDETDVSPR